MLPAGPPRAVVVFAHGWKEAPPSAQAQWPRQFAPWLEHLAQRGDAVIFPRYQRGGDVPGVWRAVDFRAGLTTAFARLQLPSSTPVVSAGYSYGGTLAFTYAARARVWGLPVPRAVDAIFPAAPIPGLPLPRLAPRTRVLVEVGDEDVVAGTWGAHRFWRWLGGASPTHVYAVVRSRPGFDANHAAPKATTPAARTAFWEPLDLLVDLAVRG